jgi:hypothetical protein
LLIGFFGRGLFGLHQHCTVVSSSVKQRETSSENLIVHGGETQKRSVVELKFMPFMTVSTC